MGLVAVGPDHRDRYLVLFPTTLPMLSVSQRMRAFIYEGKLPLTGISFNKLKDTENYKNAFEIAGPMIERIVAVCQTKEDQQTWVESIRQQIRTVHVSSRAPSPRSLPPPHRSMVSGSSPGRPWSVSSLRPSPPVRLEIVYENISSFTVFKTTTLMSNFLLFTFIYFTSTTIFAQDLYIQHLDCVNPSDGRGGIFVETKPRFCKVPSKANGRSVGIVASRFSSIAPNVTFFIEACAMV